MPTFKDVNEALEHFSKHLAIVKGEALGAQILATHALIQMTKQFSDPHAFCQMLAEKCQASVEAVSINDEDGTKPIICETAQKICDESISSIRKVLERE